VFDAYSCGSVVVSVCQTNIAAVVRAWYFPVESSSSSRAFAVCLGNAQPRTRHEIPPQKRLLCVATSFTMFTISNQFGV